ncbi:MAG TPA: PEGA domain-containing protein [Vicinamibacterales bacterium]|nr:PEGA domain-containing protein [Vicinamibacterales bacterium]
MGRHPHLLRKEPEHLDQGGDTPPAGVTTADAAPDPSPADQPSWLARFRGAVAAPARPEPPPAARDANPLLQFASESAPAATPPAPSAGTPAASRPAAPSPKAQRFSYRGGAVAAGVVLLLGVAAVPVGRVAVSRGPLVNWFRRTPPTATLTVQTQPSGAEVLIDGKSIGVSPLTLPVATGAHSISARLGKAERVVPFTFAPGAQVVQFLQIDQPPDEAAAARQTRMSITTDPPGARVEIDGAARGRSPLAVADLMAGPHRVSVVGDAGSAERTVVTSAESAVSVVFTLSHAQPADGWAVIQAPFDVQLLEHGDVIGTSGAKVMMTSGPHQLTLRNQQLGYEDARKIVITPGKTLSLTVAPPATTLSLNARPWADVTIDGEAVGQTPLSNVSIGIGAHQVVFRHPQFGERRETIVVTLKGPNRVAADFTKH